MAATAKAGKRFGKLTALGVANAKEPGLFGDGANLFLKVDERGNKSWIVRFAVGGRQRKLGLGPVHTVSLAEAREKAADARKLLQAGHDPVEAKRAAKAAARVASAKVLTFDQCAERYIEAHRAGWKSDKHAAQWMATIKTYVSPAFGSMPVKDIDTGMVMQVLSPIWAKKTETANRVRGRIESVLSWAKVHGYRSIGENPAQWRGHLDQLLPPHGKVRKVQHWSALPYAELPEFMVALRDQPGVAARALEFAIHTATRTSETLNAMWSEVDLDKKLWVIPENRMKAGREHRVPLSDAVLTILEEMKELRTSEYVFPGAKRNRPLSNMAMLVRLRRMRRDDLTAHGFRASFRTWAAERTNFQRETIEAALAHVIGDKTEEAYQRGDMFDKRRALMDAWSSYCTWPPADDARKVVPIRRPGK
jgi:integrase